MEIFKRAPGIWTAKDKSTGLAREGRTRKMAITRLNAALAALKIQQVIVATISR